LAQDDCRFLVHWSFVTLRKMSAISFLIFVWRSFFLLGHESSLGWQQPGRYAQVKDLQAIANQG